MQDGKSMAESQIPRDRRPRRNDPDRPGRSKHDAKGSRAGRTPERKSPMEPERLGEGAERKGREKGDRDPKGKGKGGGKNKNPSQEAAEKEREVREEPGSS